MFSNKLISLLLCTGILGAAFFAHAQSDEQVVTYCVDPNWMPYEAIREGIHIGISAEYIKLIGNLADIQFELVPTESWEQTLEFAQSGKCMTVALLNSSPSRKQYLDFTIPYFEAPNVLVAREGTPMLQGYAGVGARLVGAVKGYRHAEYLARYYPDLNVRYVESEAQGLKLLSEGAIDVMVGSLLSVNATMNSLKLKNLVITGYAEPYDSMGLGVNQRYSEALLPILNSAISDIPESRRVDIYKRWNNVKVINRSSVSNVLIIALAMIVVAGCVAWRMKTVNTYQGQIRRKNDELEVLQSALLEKNRTLEFLSNHDGLTGLYNRNYMMHKAEEEVSRYQRFHSSASLIVLELHNIQEIQKREGLRITEDMMKAFSRICLSTVREVDVVGRWSAEQFVVICPQTQVEQAKVLAERLVERLSVDDSLNAYHIQVAVGLAVIKENDSFTEWFDRSVGALYQSKRRGFGNVFIAE